MDVHQSGQGRGAFRKCVERRDRRGLALEDTHAVSDHAADDAVLLPLLGHLDLERLLARVILAPELVEVLRHLAVLEWG